MSNKTLPPHISLQVRPYFSPPLNCPKLFDSCYHFFPSSSPPTHFSAPCNLAFIPPHTSLKCHLSKSPTTSLVKPNSDFSIFLLLGFECWQLFLGNTDFTKCHNSIVSWFFLLCIFNCNTLSWRLYKGKYNTPRLNLQGFFLHIHFSPYAFLENEFFPYVWGFKLKTWIPSLNLPSPPPVPNLSAHPLPVSEYWLWQPLSSTQILLLFCILSETTLLQAANK